MAKKRRTQSADNGDIRTRHTIRQQKKRKKRRIRRMITLFLLLVILIGVIAFVTPIFNIQKITVIGNEKVPTENLTAMTEFLQGQNLFKVQSSQLKKAFSSEPYIKETRVKKILYPPQLKITIYESSPIAYLKSENNYALFDADGKILEIVYEQPANMPEIINSDNRTYQPGQQLATDNSEKADAILSLLRLLESSQLIEQTSNISVQDLTAVSFVYEGRLDIICGTTNDLQRKISLLKEVLTSNRLPANSRGTIDLSTAGKAIYTP